MNIWLNERAAALYPETLRSIISRDHAAAPQALLRACPAHRPTPLRPLPGIASQLGLGSLLLKDESERFGLGSFKALGGAFAVAALVRAKAEAALGRTVAPEELQAPEVAAALGELTVACASAGNHGLSVAAGARLFGCRCVVFLPESVPLDFEQRLLAKGARVVRGGDEYQAALDAAMAACAAEGWQLVADTAWEGYREIPTRIMQGYLVMAEEAAEQCEALGGEGSAAGAEAEGAAGVRDAVPSHLFLQAAVGGLAGSFAAYFADRYGAKRPKVVVVEPDGAACLLESVRAGRMTVIAGGPTVLGRLDCLEPSLVGFEILSQIADAFVTIADEDAFEGTRRLFGAGVNIGESGAAGLGALIRACEDPAARRSLGLEATSRVLIVGSEGPADRTLFKQLTGADPA